MKNPLQYYIDKRIKKAFDERIKAEELVKRAKEEAARLRDIEDDRKKRVDSIVKALITNGEYHVSIYSSYCRSYQEREGKSDGTAAYEAIMKHVVESLFTRKYTTGGYSTFSLSPGLQQDLQKLYNIKPKEK